MIRRAALAAGLLLAGSSAAIAAHGVDDPLVAERQASMKAIAEAARTIDWMFSRRRDYDSRAFKGAAETIRQHSGEALVSQFPLGSFGGHSGATAEIDRSREEFVALSNHLETFAAELSRAADEAPDRLTDDMKMGDHVPMGGSLLGRRPGRDADADPSTMPAEHVFHLMLEDCASCHAKFREKAE